jgi:dipeptidyl-peptidase-4
MIKKIEKLIIILWLYLMCYNFAFSQFNLENIFLKYAYSPDALDDVAFFSKEEKYAMLHDYPTQQKIIIYNNAAQKIEDINLTSVFKKNDVNNIPTVNAFSVSNTDKYFLLTTNKISNYRHSFVATYYLLHQQQVEMIDEEKIQYPTFSTDDKKIAFVKNNNLYYKNLLNNSTTQITNDGQQNIIINGKSDWVYEEEFVLTNAFVWNNEGSKIAYLKFDESNVKEHTLQYFYGTSYPTNFSYKYPKVGEENSKVSLHYYDLKKKKNYKIPIPENYEYIPRIYFSADNQSIYYCLLNRHQNQLNIYAYNTKTKKTILIYSEQNNAYLEVPTFVLNSDNSFFITSEKENYNQIYYYNSAGTFIQKITNGNYNVLEVLAIDYKRNLLYFKSNKDRIEEKHIFSIDLKTLNCQKITIEQGTHEIYFSPQMSYYIHQYHADNIPTQTKILFTNQSSSTILLDNNTLLKKADSLPKKEFLSLYINQDSLAAFIIKPINFDSTKQYPLLMQVYGGPGSQDVKNEFGTAIDLWQKYIAQLGYIIVCVDNSGCGGKSTAFKHKTYLNLGNQETLDQISVANFFAQQSFIDSNRIGIMGWSYGGYLSLMCLAKGNEIFKTAISIAPVSNWLWYNDVYTERYMKLPLENKAGYFNSNVILQANKIKGNLLLIHGTADDNVHIQHTYELMNKLNSLNIPYQSYIYPDKDHGISGGNTRFQLFQNITNYILKYL